MHFYEEKERELEQKRLVVDEEVSSDKKAVKALKDEIINYLLNAHETEDREFFMDLKEFQKELVAMTFKIGRARSEFANINEELSRIKGNMAKVRVEMVHTKVVNIFGMGILEKTTDELKLKFKELYYEYQSCLHNVAQSKDFAPHIKDARLEKMHNAQKAMDALAMLLETRNIWYAIDMYDDLSFSG